MPEFFENVFLTDESTFQLHRNTIKVWSSKRLPHPVKKVPKFSQKIMIWGALSKKGFFLHIYNNNETVNAEKYRETLSDFIPYADQLYLLGWVLEQDGKTPHNLRNNLIDATYKRFTKCVENDGKLVTF